METACAQKKPQTPHIAHNSSLSLLSPDRGTQKTIKIGSRAAFLQQVKESIHPLAAENHFTEFGPSEDGNSSPSNSTGAAERGMQEYCEEKAVFSGAAHRAGCGHNKLVLDPTPRTAGTVVVKHYTFALL